MDRAEVGIFKETGEIALCGLLKSEECLRLEAELTINAIADGANKPLEGSLRKEVVSGLLVALDLAKSNSARSPPHLLLHATLCRGGLLD